jgi:hypothetical protein
VNLSSTSRKNALEEGLTSSLSSTSLRMAIFFDTYASHLIRASIPVKCTSLPSTQHEFPILTVRLDGGPSSPLRQNGRILDLQVLRD